MTKQYPNYLIEIKSAIEQQKYNSFPEKEKVSYIIKHITYSNDFYLKYNCYYQA